MALNRSLIGSCFYLLESKSVPIDLELYVCQSLFMCLMYNDSKNESIAQVRFNCNLTSKIFGACQGFIYGTLVEISSVRKRMKPSVSSFFSSQKRRKPLRFFLSLSSFWLGIKHKKDSISSFLDVRQIWYRSFFIAREIRYRRLLNVRKHWYRRFLKARKHQYCHF